MSFDKIKTVEDLFKELDEDRYASMAEALADYRNTLMKHGFTRREAMRLVEAHHKFTYDAALEEIVRQNNEEVLDEAFNDPNEEEYSGFDDDDSEEYTG